MKKVERLIALLYLLKRRPGGLRTRQIAEELGTTERTVYRDIASLNEAFRDYVQIVYLEDGYHLDRTIYAPPLRLITKELEALYSVVQSLESHHPHHQLAQQALSKMKSVYAQQDPLLQIEQSNLKILAPVPKDKVNPDMLLAIEQAISQCQKIEVTYLSFSSRIEKQLKVEPYALVLRKYAWYCVGFSEFHAKIILLRVFRIKNLQPLKAYFEKPKDFQLHTFFENHWSVFQGDLQTIELWFEPRTAQLIQELQWHPSEVQTLLQDGSLRYKLHAPLNPELVAWILGWGPGCKVLSPADLQAKVVAELQASLLLYQ